MTVKERAEVHRGLPVHEIQEQMRSAIRRHTDRQFVREVPDGLAGEYAESQVGQLVRPESRRRLKVLNLFLLTAEPSNSLVGEHGIEHHQSLDGSCQRGGPAIAVIGLADGGIQRLPLHVIEAGAAVSGRVWSGELLGHERGEEVVHFLTANNLREDAVLAADTHAGVQDDGHQKTGRSGRGVSPRLAEELLP